MQDNQRLVERQGELVFVVCECNEIPYSKKDSSLKAVSLPLSCKFSVVTKCTFVLIVKYYCYLWCWSQLKTEEAYRPCYSLMFFNCWRSSKRHVEPLDVDHLKCEVQSQDSFRCYSCLLSSVMSYFISLYQMYPYIVHHSIRPVQMSFAGDPK